MAERPSPVGLLALLPYVSLVSCVTVETADEPSILAGYNLEFPDARHLHVWGEYHDVLLVIERSRSLDLPPPVVPWYRGSTEVYNFGEGHVIEYSSRFFRVGGQRYPALDDGTLFAFLEREGPWSFIYRGVHIALEREGPWRPAIVWRAAFEDGAGAVDGQSDGPVVSRQPAGARSLPVRPRPSGERTASSTRRLVFEELRIPSTRIYPTQIVYRAGRPVLEIDGRPFVIEPSTRILISEKGEPRVQTPAGSR